MHKGVVCCCVISALSVYSSVLAQQSEEKLTITTYYPSPTGVYQTLWVAPGNNPADCSAAGAPEGKMYYDASGRVLLICSNSTIGGWGYYPVPGAGGLWALNGAHLTTANTTWDVGIGTTNPLARLHVVAPSSHMLQLQQNDSTTANQYSGVGWTSGTKQAYIFVMNDHNLGAAAGGFGGSGSMNLYTGVGGNITFYTNNSNNERMRINADGNVGIGTTTPAVKLDVNGALSGFGVVPIGSIIAWHKSMAGTPVLPAGWVECNGQVLSDPDSPYNGATIPNLNARAGYNGGLFLRGGAISGSIQEATAIAAQKNRASFGGTMLENGDGSGTVISYTGIYSSVADSFTEAVQRVRPVNMAVVWIMRVK